jgi:hypothetical protein
VRTDVQALLNAHLRSFDASENRPEDLAWVSATLPWLWPQCFPDAPPAYIDYFTRADYGPYDTHDVVR